MATGKKKPKNINEYIAAAPSTHRAALKKLRSQIKKLYPKATEHISYSMPLFKYNNHPMAGFRASKDHLGLFVWSGTALKTISKLLRGYDIGKGTIRFAPNKSLPTRIVKAALDARIKEIKTNWGGK